MILPPLVLFDLTVTMRLPKKFFPSLNSIASSPQKTPENTSDYILLENEDVYIVEKNINTKISNAQLVNALSVLQKAQMETA